MSTKIIVSYDGTANEDDAIALGRLLAQAGAQTALAYVRHTHEPDSNRETLAQAEAQELLDRGAGLLGDETAARHVVTDRSTPEGLRALAEQEGADVIVFCSDSHTAKGHVAIGNSAERLLEGGRTAIAVAPVDLAETRAGSGIGQIVAIGDADGGARETADALAGALGATVAPVANADTDLLVVDSRADAEPGKISLSSSAAHLIEIATSPVLVLPRGVRLAFGQAAAAASAPSPAPARVPARARARRAGSTVRERPAAAHPAREPVARERPGEVERAAEQVRQAPREQTRQQAPARVSLGTGAHAGARYRGGRARSADDKAHRARRLPRAAAGRGALDRGRGPRRAQGPAARARPQAAGVPPRQGPRAARDPAHRPRERARGGRPRHALELVRTGDRRGRDRPRRRPRGGPRRAARAGQALSFSIEIGVLPKAELGEYRGLEVPRREPAVAEGQIDEEVQAMRERLAKLDTVERAAAEGTSS